MIIYLVRHGSHSRVDDVLCGRAADIALSAAGREQARRLAAQFAATPIDVVQSSPRQRARETAQPIATATQTALDLADAMDELDAGEWTGRSFASLSSDPAWDAWNCRRGTTRPPAGESMVELQARVLAHLDVVQRSNVEAAVIVSHAEPIRAALLHYRGIPLDRFAEIEIAPGSISVLRSAAGRLEADAVNLEVLP